MVAVLICIEVFLAFDEWVLCSASSLRPASAEGYKLMGYPYFHKIWRVTGVPHSQETATPHRSTIWP